MFRDFRDHFAIVFAAGRTEQADMCPGRLFECGIASLDFIRRKLRRDHRQIDMVVSMIRHFVPLRDFQLNQTGVLFDLLAHQEKRRRRVSPAQDVQKLKRVDRMRPVVKCQRDPWAVCIPAQDFVELIA